MTRPCTEEGCVGEQHSDDVREKKRSSQYNSKRLSVLFNGRDCAKERDSRLLNVNAGYKVFCKERVDHQLLLPPTIMIICIALGRAKKLRGSATTGMKTFRACQALILNNWVRRVVLDKR